MGKWKIKSQIKCCVIEMTLSWCTLKSVGATIGFRSKRHTAFLPHWQWNQEQDELHVDVEVLNSSIVERSVPVKSRSQRITHEITSSWVKKLNSFQQRKEEKSSPLSVHIRICRTFSAALPHLQTATHSYSNCLMQPLPTVQTTGEPCGLASRCWWR